MADILNLISTSSQNTEERYKFIQDLLVNKSDVPFANEEVNQIQNTLLSLINNQLNHSATRHDGLKLLLKTLPRCSKDVLIKHAVLWMTKAQQILDAAQNDASQVTTACEVVASLAISSKDIPELQKQVSMQNVKQLVAHVNGLPEERRFGAVFYLLAVLLYHYPEPCERLHLTIKKLILPLVDSGQENLVRAGAKCFALLTFATERSFQAPANRQNLTAWTYGQILICNSLHETMDSLFSGVTEIEHFDVWDKLLLPNISQTDLMVYYLGLERRFNNLCVFLGTILRGCGSKNSVSPSNIFKVLSRGLFVTPAGLGAENAFRKQILHLILPNLHASLLHVLDAVVSGFGKELVPYAQTILQLLQQILTWTGKTTENSATLDGGRAFKKARIQAYKSLSTWLMHAGVLSGIDNLCEEFLSHITKDIVPEKDRVVLSVQKTHNMSKRALKRHREKQYDNDLAQTSVASSSSPLLNADLAEAALIALQNIFLNTGCRLKLSFHETSQNVVVALLYDCYLETHEQTFYKRSNSCRLHLLKTLKMLQLNPHPSIPPPTQYSLEIYQMAQNDSDLSVTEEAKIGLAEIEKTVHPAAPTLRLPIIVETNSPEDDETEFHVPMDSTIRSEEAVASGKDLESPNERSLSENVENEEENCSRNAENIFFQKKSDVDTDKENLGGVSESDKTGESRMISSESIEGVEIVEIDLDDDKERSDDLCKDDNSGGNALIVEASIQEELSADTSNLVSEAEVDEPVAKKQNIEIREIVITEISKEPEGDKDSDDDTTMLDLFCDTLQEEQQ